MAKGDRISVSDRDYTPVSVETSSTATSWTTLCDVAGKGFLLKAIGANTSSYYAYLKITVDGIVVFNGHNSASGYRATGVVLEDFIKTSSTQGTNPSTVRVNTVTSILSTVIPYPYTGGGGQVCPLPIPIRFEKGYKVEVYVSSGTGHYSVLGILE